MQFHCCVYQVSSMKEFIIEADSEERAREKAVDLATFSGSSRAPDTKMIVVIKESEVSNGYQHREGIESSCQGKRL